MALAEAIGREIEAGVDGIVIGHGTDTMGHTAAILSFMVQDTPVPVVMVGSQRSSDRPSSDAALNLIHAVRAAGRGEIAEVQIGEGSSCVGCKLSETDLAENGVMIIGIRRANGEQLMPPPSSSVIQPGDNLFAFGSSQAVNEMVSRYSGRE